MIYLPVKDHGRRQIELLSSFLRKPIKLSAFAVHHKEDGTIDDEPSVCFELKDEATNVYFHEMSIGTLADALSRVGYDLKKLEGFVPGKQVDE